jgi:hypothetical protein
MKGFVITILSVSLILIVIVLSMSLRNFQLSTERALIEPLPLIYSAFLLDDVAYEFNSIVGPQIRFDERNDSTRVTLTDSINGDNHSSEINAYSTFLASEVAARTASNITANFTNLSSGMIRLFIDEDYVYTNNHTSNESLFTRANGTNATSYDINITITAVRTNITHMAFNDNGTMNVTIRYIDLNGTGTEQGRVFPNQGNTLTLFYVGGGSVTLTIGPESGNSGSLKINTVGIGADTAWSVVLPPLNATKKMGYEYDATIDYIQGNVEKRCRIGK